MTIPLAVAPTVKTPGLYLVVDLLGSPAAPGGNFRALIIAPKGAAGNLVNDTEVRSINGPDDASEAFGPGTPGHLTAVRLYAQNGLASVDVLSPTPSAGASATATTTFTGPASANSTIRLRVAGRVTDVPWLIGESATTFVARAVLAINAQSPNMPVLASQAVGDLIYTFKAAGPWGNDTLVNASIIEGGGGIAITVNPASLTGGTTEPNFTTALGNAAGREYRRIIAVLSNADATLNTSSSNAARLALHIDTFETGNQAKLQVGVVGHTGTLANVQGGAIARNNEAFQYVFGQTFEDLPGEVAGAEAGDVLKFLPLRANYNRIGNKLLLHGPADVVAEKLTANEVETLLNNGVTPLDIEPLTNELFVVRPITTHSLFSGSPDYRALDMSDTDGMYSVAQDLRTVLPIEFANCSITNDLPAGINRLPRGVVERKDVEAFITNRLGLHVDAGVVDGNELDASIENEELFVQINVADKRQVDVFLPLAIVAPLAKLGVVVSKKN